MDFFKSKSFRRLRKHKSKSDTDTVAVTDDASAGFEGDDGALGESNAKSEHLENAAAHTGGEMTEDDDDDDDDDDFITNEVKRRLKELRKNSFMVLIPEDSCLKDEEEDEDEEGEDEYEGDGETSSCELGTDPAGQHGSIKSWDEFDALYENYCQRMVFFDKIISKELKEPGSRYTSTPSPNSASKKLAMTLRSLSFKKKDEPQEDTQQQQQQLLENQEDKPYQNLETAYVAHLCLSWEMLHCQYMLLTRKNALLPENFAYSYAAQAFQQFQVLLQRYIENEPFEEGSRVDVYVRTRNSLCKLLQVPTFQGLDSEEKDVCNDDPVLASDLLKVMEESILTFYHFLKSDKSKSSGSLILFGNHNQSVNPLQLVRSSVDKKESKLKELCKRTKSWKKRWPEKFADVELLFGLIDIKVVLRVLRIEKITREQLLWCEEKMSKLDMSKEQFCRHATPVLFPC